MEIWFYHMTRAPLESALPSILRQSLARGWRVVVQTPDESRIAGLSAKLWGASETSFIAHGSAADGDADMQPVFLTSALDAPNGAAVRIFVGGAQVEPFLATPEAASCKRCLLMFNGDDPEELANARDQWRALKKRGGEMSYWQQGEAGWEKKAT